VEEGIIQKEGLRVKYIVNISGMQERKNEE
jgi:hypothetical protein